MKIGLVSRARLLFTSYLAVASACACSSPSNYDDEMSDVGGNSAFGTTVHTGGLSFAVGGAKATGGARATGGAVFLSTTSSCAPGLLNCATGGATAAGGAKATGGATAAGGAKATGGANSTGGPLEMLPAA